MIVTRLGGWQAALLLETLGVCCAPLPTHATLLVLLSIAMRSILHLKQRDFNTLFLVSSQEHELLVRFPTRYKHPFGVTFVKFEELIYRLEHSTQTYLGQWQMRAIIIKVVM